MTVSLHIHGAAATVTGSCFRLVTPRGTLLVDCGMFQGPKSLRALNYRPFPFEAASIDAVLLTHAHIDHSGLFPKLALAGFRGRAWTTAATRDLLRWLLPDAGNIQENDVERLNRRNVRRAEAEVTAIYTRADAEAALERLHPTAYDRWFEPLPGVRARMRNAGHILGSAFIELEVDADPAPVRLVFSGDLGPQDKALQPDPAMPARADILVIEATYGDTVRERLTEAQRRAILGRELTDGLRAGGNVIVPVFAVERTQEILEDIAALKRTGDLPAVPVFLDSPLAGRTTEVFHSHRAALERSDDGHPFTGGDFRFTETIEQSKAIGRLHGGAIILAGSGMCDAGRVKHHLKDHLWRHDATVLFVGYQAPGTLGALIRSGAKQVRIHGEEVRVKARIRTIDAYSGHADRDELVNWARPLLGGLGTAIVAHGEPLSLAGLADALSGAGLPRERIAVPSLDQVFDMVHRTVHRDGRWIATARPAGSEAPRLPADEASARRDWHNDYAQILLDLRTALRKAPDDGRRRCLLQEMRRVIGGRNDKR
ncbi:MAG: MBL fold metallo-hydrolase [Reyranella sp.]|nr:MBL fold metallo-hydrolase [Reyranella sp.]